MKSGEEILADIDATLDQLIQNADSVRHVPLDALCEDELVALQKTQESLLARLLHMDTLLDRDQRKKHASHIGHKVARLSKLNARLMKSVTRRFAHKKARVHRHRKVAVQALKGSELS